MRLAALTLTLPDPREGARFYRWCLDLKPDEDLPAEDGVALSWGKEDRVRLVPPGQAGGGESFSLRMSARPMEDIAAWCRETGLAPEWVTVPAPDETEARRLWPDAEILLSRDEAAGNRVRLRVRSPAGMPVELEFPLPKEVLVARGRMGPFNWRSRDWSGLEVPGLLGVRTGAPDPAALRSFGKTLGAEPMEEEAEGPLTVGVHQWIVEQRKMSGIYGFGVVMPASRLGAVQRTLAHIEVEHRLDGNRLLAADPEGRIVQIQGVRTG